MSPKRQALADVAESNILKKVEGLVSHCVAFHDCGRALNHSFMPTRVIEISQIDPRHVKLVDTKGLHASYICLSHCWGSELPLQTTKRNLVDHLQSLNWDEIPIVYQEVIQVAAHLGIYHVWIDSLCIVQDDNDDWVQESQRMCNVYENAFLTICATSSPDCRTGMWDICNDPRMRCEGVTGAGNPYKYFVREIFVEHPNARSQHAAERWPLLKRAWAYQERLLSRRLLHFGRGELTWVCQEESICECDAEFFKRPDLMDSLNFTTAIESSDRTQLACLWRKVVEHYSLLSLTKETDILPALSGVAQKLLQRQPNMRFVAGLWESTFFEDLLWYTACYSRDNWTQEQSPSLRCIPSWSWAALNIPVRFFPVSYTNARRRFLKINQIVCEPATSDPTGQVKGGGFLEVTGRVIPAVIFANAGGYYHTLRIEYATTVIDFRAFYWSDKSVLMLDRPFTCHIEHAASISGDGGVFCLPVAGARYEFQDVDANHQREVDCALVLVPVVTGAKKMYRRIGVVTISTDNWTESENCFTNGGEEDTIIIM